MTPDLTVDLINATVQIEQPDGVDRRTVGTGFLIDDPAPDGRPRTILVTAAHVLELMPGAEARIGWRFGSADGTWRYAPEFVPISDAGRPRWVRHPTQDIAVMEITAPPEFAKAAVPVAWLADASTFDEYGVGPGDEMMTLGFPRGLSANRAGFPILRTGRVASYPLSPVSAFPTFLIDLTVLPGNSGGPVFMTEYAVRRPGTEHPSVPVISGVLTKQVELEIGVVTHAVYVRETLELLDKVPAAPVALNPKPRAAIKSPAPRVQNGGG
jgi:S1-C subfamily serine protease